jgi:RNA polymerase sigma-70 factor (ECF subfamily)
MDIDELISKLRRGDKAAIAYFMDEYGPYIRGVLRKRFQPQGADLDDLCQEAIMHLAHENWCVLSQWRGQSSFKTFLVSVTVNKGIDYFRSQQRHRIPSADDEVKDDVIAEPHQIEAQQIQTRVMELLADTQPECRKLLQLKYMLDIPYQTIAEMLEISSSLVGVRLNRCLERVRILLGIKDLAN